MSYVIDIDIYTNIVLTCDTTEKHVQCSLKIILLQISQIFMYNKYMHIYNWNHINKFTYIIYVHIYIYICVKKMVYM